MNSKDKFQIQILSSMSHDEFSSLLFLYGPLIGKEAVYLYEILTCFKEKEPIPIIELEKLCHLTPTRFRYARKQLEQYNLIHTYYDGITQLWLFVLEAPKKPNVFLKHDVYSRLFLEKEGSSQLDAMKHFFAQPSMITSSMKEISEPLDISVLNSWTREKENALQSQSSMNDLQTRYPFDFNHVFKGMDRVIPQRLRTRDNLERIYDLARIFGIDEKNMRRYLSLSIDPKKSSIDFEKLRNHVISARNLNINTADPYTMAPVSFLQWKQENKPVAYADKLIIENVEKNYQLPSEVINVLIEYTLNVSNQTFSRSFVEKVASSWARLKIDTKEKALQQISRSAKPKEDLPEWYEDTRQTEADESLKEEIARIQKELRKEKHGEDQ